MLIKCNGDYSKKQDYKKGWQDGAEFGYNKANEWHYVKDGDLPPKTTLVLIKACGCFILGWLDDRMIINNIWMYFLINRYLFFHISFS